MAIHSVLSPFHCPDRAPRLLMLVADSQWRTAGHLPENSSGAGDQPHLYHLKLEQPSMENKLCTFSALLGLHTPKRTVELF